MIALGLASLVGCGGSLRRFPDRPAVWEDDDRVAFAPAPRSWYSPYLWDGADNAVFRPLAEAFDVQPSREAMNVNALDEVPDSSWYTNRLARGPLEADVVARGACEDDDPTREGVDDDVRGPFVITRGKPDGSTPGFFVRDAAGRMYMMKPDGPLQPERPSAADAIGAAIFWSAGFTTPCNRVVFVRRDELVLDEHAEVRRTDGRREPLTSAMVDAIVRNAHLEEDGRLRFSLSRFIEGRPISPWRYEGTWDEDLNDAIPHEARREVRAMYVLSSWISHIDSRQENTLATWIGVARGESDAPDAGYVRHVMIDFSDTFGILYAWTGLARRFGHSGYFDPGHIAEDFVTLGLLDRPWHHARFGDAGAVLGYYDLERYTPDAWRPGYPNPAYERMTELDAAWMARIVARFSDAHLEALVTRGRFSDPRVTRELLRIVRGRRERVLERWLTRRSPLTDATLADGWLCTEDRAVVGGIRRAEERVDAGTLRRAPRFEPEPLVVRREGARVCAELPSERATTLDDYSVVDLATRTPERDTPGPLRIHLVGVGATQHVVGLERPERGAFP